MAQSSQKMGAIWIGMALFSMFFGSGNVVFPLVVGKDAQAQVVSATIGFLSTAVVMPFLGVLAMILYQGNYEYFFGRLGKKLGFLAILFILTIWIPLGSGPRCIAVAFGSFRYYFPQVPLWLFSLLSCAIVFEMTRGRRQLLQLLGYFLTPILLVSLALIIGAGFFSGGGHSLAGNLTSGEALWMGVEQGYNTMDLIASFFFSATVIMAVKRQTPGTSKREQLKHAFKACSVGAFLLSVVYIGFMYVASNHAQSLEGIPKQEILPTLAMHLMGEKMRLIATLSIVLSCLTTVIALTYVYAEFLSNEVFQGEKNSNFLRRSIFITIALTFVMSILDFEGISQIVGPLLWWSYPPLIALLMVNLFIEGKKPLTGR